MPSRRQRYSEKNKHHELFEGMSGAKNHELYEGMSQPPRSRRQRYAASLEAKPPMACDSPEDPSLWRRITRANNRYGPRAVGRVVGNVARRVIGVPQVRVDKEGDEGDDPKESEAYFEKKELESRTAAQRARESGDEKLARVHDYYAKVHSLARQYHRDNVGRFASFSMSRRQRYALSMARG
jgi:hypothetical protein